jgi:hypothetical protein
MSEEINLERDMEPDPMFRIKCLKKQLQWMETQRYDLETTVSSLRARLGLIIKEYNAGASETESFNRIIEQSEKMLKL